MIQPNSTLLSKRHVRGVSLVETMVGIAISLVVSLIILNVLADSETQRRSSTGASDAVQNGVATMYKLDRVLRMAGSGFTYQQGLAYGNNAVTSLPDFPVAWGCQLSMAINNVQVYPRTTAFPAPFAAVDRNNLRLLPVLAYDGGGVNNSTSDVLIVMAGQSSATGRMAGAESDKSAGADEAGMLPNEFRLGIQTVADAAALPRNPCWIDRLASTYGATAAITSNAPVPKDPTYATLSGVVPEGYVPLGTNPILSMYGVNAAEQLIEFDLLGLSGTNARVSSQNVVNMQVLYGLDTLGAKAVDTWVTPAAANYTPAALSDGSAAAAGRIATILAVRLAIVVRSSQPANSTPGPATLVLFPDQPVGSQSTITFTADQQRYRYQVYDMVIPIKPVQRFLRS